MSYFSLPMGADPSKDQVIRTDELGQKTYLSPTGIEYAIEMQAQPESLPQFADFERQNQGAAHAEARAGANPPPQFPGGFVNGVQNESTQPTLGGIAGAMYQGAKQGLTAPGRALRGEALTNADPWATALDWGILGAPMKAPKGALRAGGLRSEALTPAQTQADEILAMLKAGQGSSVTDDMYSAADPMRMYNNSRLPQDEASRMARANSGVFGDDMYHGSTHPFDKFGGRNNNTEGHFGASNYLTSSADDASRHYAGMGPDLTQRVTLRAEQLADEMGLNYDDPKAFARAKSELAGGSDGVMYPVRTSGDKTYDLTPNSRTHLDYDQPQMDPKDYLDEAGGDMDVAQDLAFDDSYNFEPEGQLVDFMDNLKWNNQIDDSGPIMEAIQEQAYDGGMSARSLDDIMRETDWYAEDILGGVSNNDVYREAVEAAGFDKIRHPGDIFPGMDIEPGTVHEIVSNPANIRSKFALFDPDLKHLANLSAGIGGVGIAGVLGQGNEKQGLSAEITRFLKGLN